MCHINQSNFEAMLIKIPEEIIYFNAENIDSKQKILFGYSFVTVAFKIIKN